MLTTSTDVAQIVDRYIAAWNETDAAARRALIAETWTPGGTSIDPLMSGEARGGIDAMIAGVQGQFPGFRFRRASEVDAHHDFVRFAWELGPEDGPALAGTCKRVPGLSRRAG